VPPPWTWSGLGGAASVTAIDLNLRLAAESVAWGGIEVRRAALDATLESGRLTLRRLGFSLGGMDAALAGTTAFPPAAGAAAAAAAPTTIRFSDLTLELGGTAAGLDALLPSGSPLADFLPAEGLPVALRLAGGGPAEAVALRVEGDVGELRLEAQGTVDAPARRGGGTLTLRHPGAPRLLAPLIGRGADAWLGQGSFALIAALGASAEGLTAEHLDLVAGALRTRGQGLALTLAGVPRPRLTGRILAERLPLPGAATLVGARSEPLGLERLGRLDAELAVEAERLEIEGAPVVERASASLRLAAGNLRIEGAKARLGGGTLEGTLVVEAGGSAPGGGAAAVPRLALEAQAAEVALAAPLFGGLPLDVAASRVQGALRLHAAGHSPAALAATLAGEMTLDLRDGRLLGYDLAAVTEAARLPGLPEAEATLRGVLARSGDGETPFERLELQARIEEGRVVLTRAVLTGGGGSGATAAGSADLARGTLDLVVSAAVMEGAPPVDLRLTGPAEDPRRLPEPAAFLRWKAEHG
jgi:AsmA-like C-terminal region